MIEEVAYDADGQPLTASFMDYALPRASDFPRFELDNTVTPTPVNSLGAKGGGEAGTISRFEVGSSLTTTWIGALCGTVMSRGRPCGVPQARTAIHMLASGVIR